MTERTSAERRELIHELLAEEVRETYDDPGDTTVITAWVAYVGVQTMNVVEDDDYGWVSRIVSHPRPSTYVIEGLVEHHRHVALASMVATVLEDNE